jgi:hypothetical protein
MSRLSGKAGAVHVATQLVHACDVVFDELVDGDVTASADTTDYRLGLASNKFVCAGNLGNGDKIATDAVTSMDLSTFTELMFWIKSSVAIGTAGDLQVGISKSSSLGGTPIWFDVPALAANTWTLCRVTGDFSAQNAVISVGVKLTANDPGAFNLWLDEVRAGKAVAGIKAWALDYSMEVLDTTGFDSGGHHTYVPTVDSWAGSFDGFKDGPPLTIGSVVHLELRESATSTQQYRGSAIIKAVHPKASVEGLVLYAYDFQGTDALVIPTT